ncbi:hypothetical protein KEM48_002648 [Puccinia striiformis f. sp. tritici PST-130]|nr:hypothetical protein KEM48_002648 [Puccinia striiformis f. sp. tritici PST-130]
MMASINELVKILGSPFYSIKTQDLWLKTQDQSNHQLSSDTSKHSTINSRRTLSETETKKKSTEPNTNPSRDGSRQPYGFKDYYRGNSDRIINSEPALDNTDNTILCAIIIAKLSTTTHKNVVNSTNEEDTQLLWRSILRSQNGRCGDRATLRYHYLRPDPTTPKKLRQHQTEDHSLQRWRGYQTQSSNRSPGDPPQRVEVNIRKGHHCQLEKSVKFMNFIPSEKPLDKSDDLLIEDQTKPPPIESTEEDGVKAGDDEEEEVEVESAPGEEGELSPSESEFEDDKTEPSRSSHSNTLTCREIPHLSEWLSPAQMRRDGHQL